jgi:hypothetical protein
LKISKFDWETSAKSVARSSELKPAPKVSERLKPYGESTVLGGG